MATRKAKVAVSSKELKEILKRVKGSALSAKDKGALSDILSHSIKLKTLVERSTTYQGKKKVIASLPFGFDIVK